MSRNVSEVTDVVLGLERDLSRAEAAKAELDRELEELNDVIAQFEIALNSRKFGVPGWVTLEHTEPADDGSTWSCGLAYRKRGKKWALLIETGVDDDPDSWSVQELARASRDLRSEAVKQFPALLRDILDNLISRTQQQRDSVKIAREMAQALVKTKAGSESEQ